MTVGERIKEIRLEKGLTQREVSARCHIAEPTIRKYESGRLNPKFETMEKIAAALEVPVTQLMGWNTTGDSFTFVVPTSELKESVHYMLSGDTQEKQKKPTPVSGDGLDPELVALIKRIPADRMPEVERYLRFQAEQGEKP